jgi:hypothetical protein
MEQVVKVDEGRAKATIASKTRTTQAAPAVKVEATTGRTYPWRATTHQTPHFGTSDPVPASQSGPQRSCPDCS